MRSYVPALYFGSVTYYVRTALKETAIVPSIRQTVLAEAPGVSLYELRTMEDQVETNLRVERMVATLAACFGVVALVLASVGLYGVIAYVVVSRTREISVRLALGAARASVCGMVMKGVAVLLAAGIALGVIGARALRTTFSPLYTESRRTICSRSSSVWGRAP